ncbi:hypothetical protein ACOJBO_09725 [Rhizobium beringeri]
MPHADVADQALEPFTPGGRCTGLSLIVVDDDNLLVAPSEGDSTPRSAYCRLALSTFSTTCRMEDWRMYR